MPTRPVACRCGGTIGADRCNRCGRLKRRAPESSPRESARKRGYDRQWEKTRKLKLKRDPLCEDCVARGFVTEEAVDVHHKIKVSKRPDLKHEPSNLRSLCRRCHNVRTRRGE